MTLLTRIKMPFQGKLFLRENEEVKTYSPIAATAHLLSGLVHHIISTLGEFFL